MPLNRAQCPHRSRNPPTATPTSRVSASSCALALNSPESNVVRVTRQSQVPANPNASTVILLDLKGNVALSLSAVEVASIIGICIYATGSSNIKINTRLIITGLYYYGRGNAEVTVDFGPEGRLSEFIGDASGSNVVNIKGSQVNCASLDVAKAGAVIVNCSN